jgi:hypothetical protein
MMAALVGGQLSIAATPLHAAELIAVEQPGGRQQLGAFAGARLHMPLDGRRRERARVALTAAPTLHVMQSSGERRARIGEGLELGGGAGNRLQLGYAGRPVSRLVAGAEGPDGQRRNISPIGWVAIGVGALALLYVAAIGICTEAVECFPGE